MKRRTRNALAVLAAVAVSGTLVAAGASKAPAGGPPPGGFVQIYSEVDPNPTSVGAQALWSINIFAGYYVEGDLHNTVAYLTAEQGSFDLTATKALNGNICKEFTPTPDLALFNKGVDNPNLYAAESADGVAVVTPKAKVVTNLKCTLGTVDGDGEDGGAFLDIVVNTAGATGEAMFLDVEVCADEGCEFTYDELQLNPADPSAASGYVPPGGTLILGAAKATSGIPTVAAFKLPKKISNGAEKPKQVPGPGAFVDLTGQDPAEQPTFCGGLTCNGVIVNLTDFPGYTDAKHPAQIVVQWFAGTVETTGQLYGKKEVGDAFPIPACIKVKGAVTNTPCLAKHKVKKGTVTDTIYLLSGDPGVGRR